MNLQRLDNMTHYDHSRKVSQISGLLALGAGYSPKEADLIKEAALFHDIGKEYIPADILQKPSKLTPEEYAVVKTHTALGAEQLNKMACLLEAAEVISRMHHERYDGKGGYIGITGEDIHPYARLVAVADVFDALYSKRAYKSAWSIGDIIEYMEQNAGTQFDQEYVGILLRMMDQILSLYLPQSNHSPILSPNR